MQCKTRWYTILVPVSDNQHGRVFYSFIKSIWLSYIEYVSLLISVRVMSYYDDAGQWSLFIFNKTYSVMFHIEYHKLCLILPSFSLHFVWYCPAFHSALSDIAQLFTSTSVTDGRLYLSRLFPRFMVDGIHNLLSNDII